jgi:hypothetical protein
MQKRLAIKKALISLLALFNTFEGVIHIVVAVVGLWGIFDTGTYDWRLFVAPVENLVFGLFSVTTGYLLKEMGLHHNYHQ